MSLGLGVMATLCLAAAVGVLAGALVAAALANSGRGRRLLAVQRADRLLLLLLLPPLCGLLLVLTLLAPALGHLLGLVPDHCPSQLHPAAVCAFPVPLLRGGLAEAMLLAVGLGALLHRLPHSVLQGLQSRRVARCLEGLAQRVDGGTGSTPDWSVLPTRHPLAFTIGLLRPRVYVSAGLRAALDAPSLCAVLAHEEAHRQRYDGLRILLGDLARSWHLPGTGRRLMDGLRLASEQACDEVAARRTGDACTVARALLASVRLQMGAAFTCAGGGADAIDLEEATAQRAPTAWDRHRPFAPHRFALEMSAGAGGDELTERVESLLRFRGDRSPVRSQMAAFGLATAGLLVAVCLLGGQGDLHHGVDALILAFAA